MDRRRFLAGLGGLGGYSVLVDARRFASDPDAGLAAHHSGDDTQTPVRVESGAAAPSAAGAPLDHEPNMRVVEHRVDLLVAGGGMSGVCAALAAARHGARVLLVQDRSRLGGNASSEIRMHIVGADCHGGRSGWREGGLIEEIRLRDATQNPQWAWELFDLLLYDLCRREESLEVLLDTSVYRVEKSGESIASVWARCDKTETVHHVTAEIYLDCTGDCRLGLEAGAAFRTGREPRAEFEESLAVEQGDSKSQGCSLLFTARKHDRPMPFVAPPWARELTEQDLLFRKPSDRSYEYGYWWIELGGERDVIHDNEELRFELLRVVLGVWNWIKNSGERPNSANWALETVGMIPGKRESRRMEGDHVQRQSDLEGAWRERDDGVAIGGWAFDDHPPGGFDAWDEPPFRSKRMEEAYNIAFEALYSRNVPNLMMAGRNISNSHVAFTSTRVMATCSSIGQAVGTAAALCVKHSCTPRTLRRERMKELQQVLLRDDQTIRGVGNEDSLDLARRATAQSTASGPGAASQVLDGQVRDVPGQWEHRWGADAENGPVTLELRWPEPVEVGHVQITFDSGFHRELTLSASHGVQSRVVRGPQPETVRHYTLRGRRGSEEFPLAEEHDNHLRLRRHDFEVRELDALLLTVHATHGSEHVRVFEVRCYREPPGVLRARAATGE